MERTKDFPASASSPSLARHFVGDAITEFHCDSAADVAQLLVSELVGNAVQHAKSPTQVTVSVDHGRLLVRVRDHDVRRPVARVQQRLAPNGRGLLILDRLATHWGIDEEPGGKTVWFELA